MTRILVADDDHLISKLLKLELGQKGFDIITAYDGNAAWDIIKNPSTIPDIVLLDMNMPGLSGDEVLGKIKSNSSTEHLPVIIITTRNALKDLSDSVEKGILDYLIKPFTMDQILARVLSAHRKARSGVHELPKNLEPTQVEALQSSPSQPTSMAQSVETELQVAPQTPLEKTTTPHLEVLFVECFEANKQSLSKHLQKLGHKVTLINHQSQEDTEEKTLTALTKSRYDIVIIDAEPDYLNGYALSKKIRRFDQEHQTTRAIIGIGLEQKSGDGKQWLAAGMSDYFQKPVPVKSVLDAVQHFAQDNDFIY